MRIAVLSNTAWYLFNFRLNLMNALRAAGHEVVAISPADAYLQKLESSGIVHRRWDVDGAGTNPVTELVAVWLLYKLLRQEKINLLLTYTPKGNIYGAFAARFAGISVVSNVSGLGQVFIGGGWLTAMAKVLYRIALRTSEKVFFQNRDDMQAFIEAGIVVPHKADRLPGSGVDVRLFMPSEEGVESSSSCVFLLVARMLWDKGVGEFVEAARRVRAVYPQARFQLLGFLGVDNPSAIPQEQIAAWVEEGVVEYLGSTDDVVHFMLASMCVVLPSYYREGIPRSLLEAASLAKPIITTDTPGCREAVDDGETGFLCRPKDAGDLADKMLRIISMPLSDRLKMGRSGREKMMREFDEQFVIQRYMAVIDELSQRGMVSV